VEKLSYEDMYQALRRLHDSSVDATNKLQEENRALREEVILSYKKLENAQKSLDITKEIMRNALIEQNRVQVEYGKEIQELKAKIRDLESHGHNN